MQGPCITKEVAHSLDVACLEEKRVLYALGVRAPAATFLVFRLTGPLPLSSFFPGSYGNISILGNGCNNHFAPQLL